MFGNAYYGGKSINYDKVDEMALALLYLSTFEEQPGYKRAWKNFAWEITGRLYDKGFISDPKNKNKSLILTNEGAQQSEELFLKYFGKDSDKSRVESMKPPFWECGHLILISLSFLLIALQLILHTQYFRLNTLYSILHTQT